MPIHQKHILQLQELVVMNQQQYCIHVLPLLFTRNSVGELKLLFMVLLQSTLPTTFKSENYGLIKPFLYQNIKKLLFATKENLLSLVCERKNTQAHGVH